ncbi:OLC1v1013690C1 [Oldenlandia corymbosa var. corymbosa]|uniref:Bidirectional sugar transporter SWEET n=1 Tax=Oldenlandia corymbosa var. corymbosa TaxID=529605 RepID=A0AAV1E2B8_OLDCO|nr:OLC1v1013690C1 [Oldenlandia corymbosa var. corymbosa]
MALFGIHNPWVMALGILGNIISLIVYLAPAPTFYRIIRKKSTEGFHSFPYVVSLLSCMLWIDYAIIRSDVLLITINSIGCLIETVYILLFIVHATRETKICTLKLVILLNVITFGLICVLTEFLTKGPQKIRILGWINVSLAAAVFVAPLSIMKKVINTRSVEFMPFWLSFSLVLSAVTWFTYGLLLKDMYITVPNIVGFLFGMVQVALYVKYKKFKMEAKEPQPSVNSCEIYPVRSSSSINEEDLVVVEITEQKSTERLGV